MAQSIMGAPPPPEHHPPGHLDACPWKEAAGSPQSVIGFAFSCQACGWALGKTPADPCGWFWRKLGLSSESPWSSTGPSAAWAAGLSLLGSSREVLLAVACATAGEDLPLGGACGGGAGTALTLGPAAGRGGRGGGQPPGGAWWSPGLVSLSRPQSSVPLQRMGAWEGGLLALSPTEGPCPCLAPPPPVSRSSPSSARDPGQPKGETVPYWRAAMMAGGGGGVEEGQAACRFTISFEMYIPH